MEWEKVCGQKSLWTDGKESGGLAPDLHIADMIYLLHFCTSSLCLNTRAGSQASPTILGDLDYDRSLIYSGNTKKPVVAVW